MWTIAAFLALGFLIGNLAGLTSESITNTLMGLLFAFAGGSAITFMHKLDEIARANASKAIFSLALACLLGIYSGIFISEHQLLSPHEQKVAGRANIESRKYLRENLFPLAQTIDQKKANGHLTPEEAYEQLYKLIKTGGEDR